MMAKMMVRLFNAARQQLDDLVDLNVIDTRTNVTRAQLRRERARKTFAIDDLRPGETYLVQAFPLAHRPVQQFAGARDDAPTNVHLFCPIHPDRARPTFPPYPQLDQALRETLEQSTLEVESNPAPANAPSGATPGEQLYTQLTDLQKAGLLNVYRKLAATPVGGVPGWQYVTDLYRIRGDRFFANVRLDFRDQVKTEVTGKRFQVVEGTLHTPPPGYRLDDSFKTGENYGNLQLTFFASVAAPLLFRVDADIDDAGGIGHVFQVLRNWLTGGETHPYDIHQILAFHQMLKPQYDLSV
jgi:hypothetical protein